MHRLSCLFNFKCRFIYTGPRKPVCEHTCLEKVRGLIYILLKVHHVPYIFYAHEVSTYTDVKERLTGDSCATPRCDEAGWA